MLEEFDIHIKDNFLDKEIYKSIYDKIPFYTYSGNYGYHNIEGSFYNIIGLDIIKFLRNIKSI